MSRKVFISALGANLYQSCKYIKEGFVSRETTFIQEATLSYLHADQWKPTDQIYILTTPKAKKLNWNASITEREDHKNKVTVPYCGLEHVLATMPLACPFCQLDIEEHPDKDQEMWSMFTTLYDHLQEGDELYIDLTHGFRYFPMLILVFCNYASYMKHTTTVSLTYGNFEGSSSNEKNIEDLTPLSNLQDWTFAAATFKKFGRMSPLSASLEKGNVGWNRNVRKKTMQEFCTKILKNIALLDQEFNTCRGYELQSGKTACEIQVMIQKALMAEHIPSPVRKLLSAIQDIINPFVDNPELDIEKTRKNLNHAICWCIRNNMIQQGYTLGQESIITLLYEELKAHNPYTESTSIQTDAKRKEQVNKERKLFRQFLSSVIAINDEDLKNRAKWKGGIQLYPDLAVRIISQPWYCEIKKPYESLTKNRNEINHGGFHSGATPAAKLAEELQGNFQKCMSILEAYHGKLLPVSVEVPNKEKLLINLSNHPLAQWSREQLAAAIAYGTCVDYPFPQVPSDADEALIRTMAENLVTDILTRYPDKKLTIHLMGELTLTYQAVKLFHEHQISCIAATTERIVTETEHERISRFQFCKFRKYN